MTESTPGTTSGLNPGKSDARPAPATDDAAPLEKSSYVRAKLYDGDKSNLRRYADLVVGENASYWQLLKYEFITCTFGYIPGALGLVIRKKIFPSLFKSCGRGVIFGRNLTIRNAKNITLGEQVIIDDDCVLDARGAGDRGVTIGDRVILNRGTSVQAKIGPISIGSDSDIGMHSDVHSQGGVEIGKQVVLGGSAKISGGVFQIDRDPSLDEREQARATHGPIRIDDKCLVGMGSSFLDGVHVGEGAVLGAGCVVIRDLPAYCVAAGVPAKVLRMRESKEAATVS